MNKEDLKHSLTEIIRQIGKYRNGKWKFNLDKLLERWEKFYPKKKFKSFGFGNLHTFLTKELEITDLGSREFSLSENENKLANEIDENTDVLLKPEKIQTEKGDGPKDGATSAGKPKKEYGENLKLDIVIIVKDLSEKDGNKSSENFDISLELLWRSLKEKKVGGNFGSSEELRQFLLGHCFVDFKEIGPTYPSDNEVLSFNKKAIREYLKSCGIGEECCVQEEIQQPESEQEIPPSPSNIAKDRPRGRPVPSESTEKPSSCPENPKFRSIQLVCVMYDYGLEALRKLYLRLHPGWKNTPRDVAQLKRGNLRVDDFEKERFESGDINQWDITLICKVLLFSEVSSAKLKTEEYRGYEDAIKSLRNIKNNFISHKNNPKLTTNEYKESMNCMQDSLMAIGLPKDEFLLALEDADISTDNLFYKMYLEEVARSLANQIEAGNKSLLSQLETGHKKLSKKVEESVESLRNEIKDVNDLVVKILNKQICQHEIPAQAAKQDSANWDEWLKVKSELNNFDSDSNQYILIVDKLHPSDASYLTALGNIPWKLVLDLDPDSENNGLLKTISPFHENSGIIVMHTPTQLLQRDRAIDFKRVQWVFANGRNQDADEDAPKERFEDWRRCFKTPICNLINNCSLKLDPSKPVFCVVLNLQNSSTKIAKSLVEEIDNMFPLNNFKLKFMFFTPEFDLEEFTGSCYSNLSTKFLFLGINAQLGQMNDTFQLPSAQEGVPVPLPSKKYYFLSEYLEILYKGCENIPEELPEKEKKKFERHHLKSFLKGNLISCESLEYGHDCERSITKKITNRIQKMCLKNSTSQIVQISHSPGTGGSTIARRVLWDLHTQYPCAIVKTGQTSDSFATEGDSDQSFITNLSERIGELEETCELKPIVLIDGNSRQVRNISDHLVRKLNADGRAAIILRVVHPQGDKKENDSYFQKESNFEVKSVLEDTNRDLESFRKTYHYYYGIFDKNKSEHKTVTNLKRVFHFPMMAMLGDFEKLEGIVKESLDILKRGHAHEYEVAVLVAFLQIYANWETPISLIEKFLQTKLAPKEGSKHLFSEDLLCLMVSKKAQNKKKWIGYQNYTNEHDVDSDYSDDYDSEEDEFSSSNQGVECCTFQHFKVAEIVIEHSRRNLDDLTDEFVKSVVVENNNQNRFRDLINDLFLYNKEATDDHFSRLVMKLKKGGRIFEEAAKKTKDATFYSHVARYYAMQETPPDFQKAKDLIKEGLKVDKFSGKDKTRGVRDAEGHILLREMKSIKASHLTDVEKLEKYAKEAISCFRRARDNPPMTYPNPLMGEVNVWQFCFDWIIKWKNADVEAAIAYMMEEEFFETAIGDCFYLLDQIDSIVQSVPWLVDPTHTMMLANESRMSLMQVLGTTKGKTGRNANVQSVNIARLCEEICSKKNFKNANEKEITRLRVSWMMNQAGKDIHLLHEVDRPVLLRLLEKLVLTHGAYEYANNLMTVSSIQQDINSYTLNQALEIVRAWQSKTPHDAFSFFYEYIISFLYVINGSIIHFRSPYQLAIDACNKKCESNHRKFIKRYYLAKDRDTEKLCCLISPSELEKLCNEDRVSNKQKQKPADHHPERKHLFECHGRVKLHKVRGKKYPYIALEQGNLKIGVEKNSLGKPYQDFTPDSKVTFFVYFTLDGPRAKDIHFDNAVSSSAKLSRQISKKGKTSE